MNISIALVSAIPDKTDTCYLISEYKDLTGLNLTSAQTDFIKRKLEDKASLVGLNLFDRFIWIVKVDAQGEDYQKLEKFRKTGAELYSLANKEKITSVCVSSIAVQAEYSLAFLEGAALAGYQFLRHKKNQEKKNHLEKLLFVSDKKAEAAISGLNNLIKAVFAARDLVNEPVNYLNAVQLADEIKRMGREAGARVEVLNKAKIESLKMGGILAVNKGSITPPTFTIIEHKPAKAFNKKPIVLVGKGVVYDTGGLSLKPTAGSMDFMKSDMAGAAAVACAVYLCALNDLPVHVVGLIPATDNRPGGEAYAPGDVITMYNGLKVEVLNTDAEGRMILADALSYARKYKPELVIDLATLTGAAVMAVGSHASIMMGNAGAEEKIKLEKSGERVYERLVELPLWDEYGEYIKSPVADIKNIGGKYAGSITAGKFLEHFVEYPWVHLDIAGPAFSDKTDSYRTAGGSGVGVRLLYDFLKNLAGERKN